MTTPSIMSLYLRATARENNEKSVKEKEKLGNLRAGNSGTILADGSPAGSCPRVAHLRMLGIKLEEASDATELMWQLGYLNEDLWVRKLTSIWEGGLLQEEEIPISWTTSTDIQVTGRPDIVLLDRVGDGAVPVLGLELKAVCSLWTLRDTKFSRDPGPKLAHLCQAGHYSIRLGEAFKLGGPLPYKIIYTSYTNFSMPDWAARMFPRQGEPGSEFISYNEKGELKNLNPTITVYDLEWRGEVLVFREEGIDREWTTTPVTMSGIESYFEQASTPATISTTKIPKTMTGSGGKVNYSTCGYCPLQDVCVSHGKTAKKLDYDLWLRDVRRHVTANNKK